MGQGLGGVGGAPTEANTRLSINTIKQELTTMSKKITTEQRVQSHREEMINDKLDRLKRAYKEENIQDDDFDVDEFLKSLDEILETPEDDSK